MKQRSEVYAIGLGGLRINATIVGRVQVEVSGSVGDVNVLMAAGQ